MKSLTGRTVKCRPLGGLRDARGVQLCLPRQDGGSGGFKHRVQPPDDRHRQDDVAVFGAVVDVMEHIISDAPDESVDVHAIPLTGLPAEEGDQSGQSDLAKRACSSWRNSISD